MQRVKVNLNTITKIKKFVNVISKYEYDLDLVSGRYIVDAKSIMGIFSLDLSQPIEMVIHSDEEAVLRELDEFIET